MKITDEMIEVAARAMAAGANVEPEHYYGRARRALEAVLPLVESGDDLERRLLALLRGQHSSLILSFNDENGPNYESVAEAVDAGYLEASDWVSRPQFRRSVASNKVWTLQWYPDTPVGFYRIHAADVAPLIAAACKLSD